MLRAARKALAQCFSHGFGEILLRVFLLSVVVLTFLSWLLVKALAFIPDTPWGWVNTAITIAASLGVFAGALLLVVPVAMALVGLFLEEIAVKVEARHYPGWGPARQVALGESLRTALSFAGTALVLNLLALPVYIFLPGLNLALYLVLNGGLIGREYYELVAARHIEPATARALRRRHAGLIHLAGGMVALLLLIPGVNFIAPLFGTALMVHVVAGLASGAEPLGLDRSDEPLGLRDDGDSNEPK